MAKRRSVKHLKGDYYVFPGVLEVGKTYYITDPNQIIELSHKGVATVIENKPLARQVLVKIGKAQQRVNKLLLKTKTRLPI